MSRIFRENGYTAFDEIDEGNEVHEMSDERKSTDFLGKSHKGAAIKNMYNNRVAKQSHCCTQPQKSPFLKLKLKI